MIQEIIISIISLVAGGGLTSIITIKQINKKSKVDVKTAETKEKTAELENVHEAIKIWREMAEGLKQELESTRKNYIDMTAQVEKLRCEKTKLTTVNNIIFKFFV